MFVEEDDEGYKPGASRCEYVEATRRGLISATSHDPGNVELLGRFHVYRDNHRSGGEYECPAPERGRRADTLVEFIEKGHHPVKTPNRPMLHPNRIPSKARHGTFTFD